MDDNKKDDSNKIKKDFIKLIETRREEREIVLAIFNTLSLLAAGQEDISGDIKQIREMIVPDDDLAVPELDRLNAALKDKLIERAKDAENDGPPTDYDLLSEKIIESCRIMKRIMAAVLEDFYPLPGEMQQEADLIKVECKGDPLNIDVKKPSENLVEFIEKLKIRISDDFNDINGTFFNLLGQVKDLEKSLIDEFGNDKNIKEIEYFEMNINKQVGNIAESFNSYSTIKEIKNVVIEKLKKIKGLVSLRKKEEIEKAKAAQENIKKLNKKINAVEKKAKTLSKKAREYQDAAMRDGLTGLFSRGAFDIKIKEFMDAYREHGNEFSIIVFDVNKFKKINDTLGHVAGDKVLKKVAECLEETFRKDDFVARYGGDEFIVIIDDLTPEMADERITNFNQNLKKRRFVSHKHGEVNLGVSAGTATIREDDTLETIIDRADKAMYESKQKNA